MVFDILEVFFFFFVLQNEIHDKVEAMGGTVSRDLTNNVTHLIAGEVGSKKYQVMYRFGQQGDIILLSPPMMTRRKFVKNVHASQAS